MQLSKEEFDRMCAALPEGMHWGDPLTPDAVRHIVAAIFAQADARPVATVAAVDEYGPILHWETHWADLIGAKLYTHPEASAPGLSREDSDLLRELLYRVEYDPGSPTEEKLHQAYEIITRGRAAILRLPPTTGLPQAAYCASAASVAEPSPEAINEARHHFDEKTARLLKEQTGFAAEVAKIGKQQMPTHDQLRAIARDVRNTVGPSDDPGREAYVHAGWRAALTAQQQAEHVEFGADCYVIKDTSTGVLVGKQQAEPGADERATVAERCAGFAELYKTDHACGREAEEACDAIADACRTYAAQSGQRAGVADALREVETVCRSKIVKTGDDFALGAHHLAIRILAMLAAAPTQQQEGGNV